MAVECRNFGDFGAVQPLDQAAWLPRYLGYLPGSQLLV